MEQKETERIKRVGNRREDDSNFPCKSFAIVQSLPRGERRGEKKGNEKVEENLNRIGWDEKRCSERRNNLRLSLIFCPFVPNTVLCFSHSESQLPELFTSPDVSFILSLFSFEMFLDWFKGFKRRVDWLEGFSCSCFDSRLLTQLKLVLVSSHLIPLFLTSLSSSIYLSYVYEHLFLFAYFIKLSFVTQFLAGNRIDLVSWRCWFHIFSMHSSTLLPLQCTSLSTWKYPPFLFQVSFFLFPFSTFLNTFHHMDFLCLLPPFVSTSVVTNQKSVFQLTLSFKLNRNWFRRLFDSNVSLTLQWLTDKGKNLISREGESFWDASSSTFSCTHSKSNSFFHLSLLLESICETSYTVYTFPPFQYSRVEDIFSLTLVLKVSFSFVSFPKHIPSCDWRDYY